MNIKCLGTGTFGSKTRGLTSFLINDEILFDCGNGTIRQLRNLDFDLSKIKYIIITHFHIDHTADLTCYFAKHKIQKIETIPTIISPQGLKNLLFNEFSNHSMNGIADYALENAKYIEIVDGENIKIGDYEITAREVIHGDCVPSFGYEINEAGFSGDSGKCAGLDKIVENSEVIFADTTRADDSNEDHLNLAGVINYAEQFPDKTFYLIHRGDFEINDLPNNIKIPNDGDEIEVSK